MSETNNTGSVMTVAYYYTSCKTTEKAKASTQVKLVKVLVSLTNLWQSLIGQMQLIRQNQRRISNIQYRNTKHTMIRITPFPYSNLVPFKTSWCYKVFCTKTYWNIITFILSKEITRIFYAVILLPIAKY